MQYVYFIGGKNREGTVVSVAIGVGNPEHSLQDLQENALFDLVLLGIEEGGSEKYESVKLMFQALHYKGPWFQAKEALMKYIEALPEVDRGAHKTKRVSVDLTAEDFALTESLISELGLTRGKADLFRKALKAYNTLHRYSSQGYMIQAVKGGKMVQFPDIKSIEREGS